MIDPNLPPGVTQSMIDRRFGGDEETIKCPDCGFEVELGTTCETVVGHPMMRHPDDPDDRDMCGWEAPTREELDEAAADEAADRMREARELGE